MQYYTLIKNIYFTAVSLSFLVSLVSFKWHYPFHLKLFSGLLGLTFLTELFATQIGVKYFHWTNNSGIYNSFTIIEFMTYAYYYYCIISVVWIRNIIKGFMFFFPFFWFITVFFVFGFDKWNSYVILMGAFFSVCFALGYYYQILKSKKDIYLLSHPEFWIATGMLILYSCQLPYFGMLNYLNKNYLILSRSFWVVLLVINTCMYLLFTYAFLCKKIHRKYL